MARQGKAAPNGRTSRTSTSVSEALKVPTQPWSASEAIDGGEGGIRTHGAFAHRFSRAAPSTTRTPLRARGYPRSAHGSRVELLDLVASDAADDLHATAQRGVLRELDLGPRGAVGLVRNGEDELLDIG